ncbi:MAG: 30S ribosomal protein S4 [Bdellovibrionaceae bacterium]|nr:30S ribosomal protein S4 [Pseudobdellovibrionaceae bacterium]
MSCVVNSVCKLCRRENLKLYLKGSRCLTDKCAFERRPYPPGQHGQSRLKFSEFALQLREKQKAKRWYGITEKQFSLTFEKASRATGTTGTELLKRLEMRLDNVIFNMGLASSRRQARQLILHKHFTLNGSVVNIPSLILKKDDIVKISDSSANLEFFKTMAASSRTVPGWLEVSIEKLTGKIKDTPVREDISLPVEENMIVEYYSR